MEIVIKLSLLKSRFFLIKTSVKVKLAFSYLFLLFSLTLSAQNSHWARRFGNSDLESITGPILDDSSNLTYVGRFVGTFDFDPGPGVFNLTPSGYSDIFMVKLNANGNFISAIKFGGTDGDGANGIVKDKVGNIYIYGDFRGTMDCDPGPGVYNITTARPLYSEHFIMKFNPSGNIIWAKNFGEKRYSGITRLQFDDSLNIYCSGVFADSSDFDPGPGVHILKRIAGSMNSMFLMKLTSNGNLAWATALGGNKGYNTPRISINKIGNVYVTGSFEDTCDFDPGPGQFNLIGNGLSDIFILKLTPNGNFIWAKKIGGGGIDGGGSLIFDDTLNIILSGDYQQSVDFDTGPGTQFLHTSLTTSSFILKLDSSGNFKWVRDFKGSNVVQIGTIVFDSLNNLYVGGTFRSTADFDPGPGVFNLTSAGDYDVFLLKFNNLGNLIWGRRFGGTNAESGGSILLDKNGNIYTRGTFRGTVDFDPGPPIFNLTSTLTNETDVYVLKLNSSGILPVNLLSFSGELVAENTVKLDWTSANELNNSHFEIERTLDPLNHSWQKIGTVKGAGTTNKKTHYTFLDESLDLQENKTKIVYYRLKQVDFDGKFEYVGKTIIQLGEPILVKIYPNPVENTLYLSSATNIKIYNTLGILQLEEQNISAVNVSDLPKGIYIAQITVGLQIQTLKFIKE